MAGMAFDQSAIQVLSGFQAADVSGTSSEWGGKPRKLNPCRERCDRSATRVAGGFFRKDILREAEL